MKCPLCGSGEGSAVKSAFPDLVKCRCDFIYFAGEPKSSDPDLYESQWSKDELHPTFMYADGRYVVRNEQKLTDLLDRLEPYRKLNRLLDVGCSAAFFLKLAKERNWQVQGVEVSDFGVKFSREVLKIDVFQGMLDEANFPAESFDVVHSSHVLEHVADPPTLLKEINRILRVGGVMVTTVPTQFSDPGYRLFGKVHGEGPPRHVSYFTKRTFVRMVRSLGFTPTYVAQNIELKRLVPGGVPKETPQADLSQPASLRTDTTAHNRAIRFIKSGVNAMASLVGVGDELTAIAVKRQT